MKFGHILAFWRTGPQKKCILDIRDSYRSAKGLRCVSIGFIFSSPHVFFTADILFSNLYQCHPSKLVNLLDAWPAPHYLQETSWSLISRGLSWSDTIEYDSTKTLRSTAAITRWYEMGTRVIRYSQCEDIRRLSLRFYVLASRSLKLYFSLNGCHNKMVQNRDESHLILSIQCIHQKTFTFGSLVALYRARSSLQATFHLKAEKQANRHPPTRESSL